MYKDFYSIKEFSFLLRVSEKTVRRAIKKGRINAFRIGYSQKSSFRIPGTEINRMGLIDLENIVNRLVDEKIGSKKDLDLP